MKTKTNSGLRFWKAAAYILLGVVVFTQVFNIKIEPKPNFAGLFGTKTKGADVSSDQAITNTQVSEIEKKVLPSEGVELPITWGDMGKKMIADGVIDESKFTALFPEGLGEEEQKLLSGNQDGKIIMTEENSRFLLDAFWGFGLANNNAILKKGEMTDKKYGGDASKFASTGGWTLARGNVMDHYSKHAYMTLSKDQQDMVDRVSRGIFRPCCGNSTHFPDCNHGMAMLGLLELMAAKGVSEEEMYKVALKVNSYWFPQTYLDLATYFKEQGKDWSQVDPKLVLGADYSSAQGYMTTRKNIKSLPQSQQGGSGCGA